MQEEVGSQVSHDGLEQALSLERFGRYIDWASGDRERAIDLYAMNIALSESLYTPLQVLEVVLRNRIHRVMTDAMGEAWFDKPGSLLGTWQADQLAKAVEDIRKDGKQPTPGRVVAELTLGFWTAMFGRDYETLWQTTLRSIAKRPDGKGLRRKDFSGPLASIRTLRNRIAHHEPILAWDLRKSHVTTLEMIGWLSPPAAAWCQTISRFDQVYPTEGIVLGSASSDR